MPLSAREAALAAFHARVAEIPGPRFVGRNVNHDLTADQIPALITLDGGDDVRRENSSTGELRIDTEVSVLVIVLPDEDTPIGPYINEWAARVREALAIDWTLGSRIWWVQYEGLDGPVAYAAPGGEPLAEIMMNFVLVRSESELDPYES